MESFSLEAENVQPPLGFLLFPPLQFYITMAFISLRVQATLLSTRWQYIFNYLLLIPSFESENKGTSAITIRTVQIPCILQNHTITITPGLTGKTRLEQTTQKL